MSENTYYYKWNIPSDAFVGYYTVEYEATIDGDYGEKNYTIKVN